MTTHPIETSATITAQLDEARQAATAALAQAESTLGEARAAMDGSPPAAATIAQAEAALASLRTWHADRIATLEQELARARESEGEQGRESEARAFLAALVAQSEALPGEWRALRSLAKAAERVAETSPALGLAVPSSVAAETLARLPAYVAELPPDHPMREAYAVATRGIRYQRRENATGQPPRQNERLAVAPLSALCLPVRGLDDEDGLGQLVLAERTLRSLANTLAAGITRVEKLRARRRLQAEDDADDLTAGVRGELAQERQARGAKVRAEIFAGGRYDPHNVQHRQEVEQLVRERLAKEAGPVEAAQERLRERVAARREETHATA